MIMKKAVFIRGIIIGAALGAAVCLIMPDKKKLCKSTTAVGKLLKSAGKAVDNLSDYLGL